MFSAAQVEQLLRPLNPRRVQRNDKGMSHLAAYDVSAHLTRIFGFGGWRKEILVLELVDEVAVPDPKRAQRLGWYVTYRCSMRLHVGDWWNDDGATGSASNLPDRGDAHDFAMKNAISYALKRCAKDLGDQFGLGLYNKGSLAPLVIRVLTGDDRTGPVRATSIDEGLADLAPDWDEDPPAERDDGRHMTGYGLSRTGVADEALAANGEMDRAAAREHAALRKGADGKLDPGEQPASRTPMVPRDDPFYVDGQDTEALRRKAMAAMFAQFAEMGVADDKVFQLGYIGEVLGREVTSRGSLNVTELTTVNVMLQRRAVQAATP